MKVIADVVKQTLRMFENERSIFRGEYGVDKLELYINKKLENEYPTITGLLSNGRKIGPYTTDDAYSTEVIDGVTYTKASFTLSKQNGFTLSEGKMMITIWMNSNGRKEAIGNVTLNVINTTAFDDGDIIVSGDVAGTIVNYRVELENLQSQINTSNVAFNNRITMVEQVKADKQYVDFENEKLLHKIEQNELDILDNSQKIDQLIQEVETKATNEYVNNVIDSFNEMYDELYEDKVDKTHLTENYYNKEQIKNMLNFTTSSSLSFKIVDSLPTEDINPATIYLVPYENEYEEFIYIYDKWEMLGSTKINISEYATKGYVDSKIESSIITALEGDY